MIERAGSIQEDVAEIAPIARTIVAILERDDGSAKRYASNMLSEWLQSALMAADISQAELSRRLTAELGRSIDRSAVNKMTKGIRDIGADEMIAIEKILDVRAPRGEPRRLTDAEEYAEEQEAFRQRSIGRAYNPDGYTPTIKGAIPEIDVQLGAGEGMVGEMLTLDLGGSAYSGHKVVEEWLFPEEYLRSEIQTAIAKTLVMPIRGDSMEPTYRPGDRVLVDCTQRTLTEDTVYVISDGESPPQIKRLQRVMFSQPTMVEIISDNPANSRQTVELDRVKIIGRVVGVVSRR